MTSSVYDTPFEETFYEITIIDPENKNTVTLTPNNNAFKVKNYDKYYYIIFYDITYRNSQDNTNIKAKIPYYVSDGHTNFLRANMVYPLNCISFYDKETNIVNEECIFSKKYANGLLIKLSDMIINLNLQKLHNNISEKIIEKLKYEKYEKYEESKDLLKYTYYFNTGIFSILKRINNLLDFIICTFNKNILEEKFNDENIDLIYKKYSPNFNLINKYKIESVDDLSKHKSIIYKNNHDEINKYIINKRYSITYKKDLKTIQALLDDLLNKYKSVVLKYKSYDNKESLKHVPYNYIKKYEYMKENEKETDKKREYTIMYDYYKYKYEISNRKNALLDFLYNIEKEYKYELLKTFQTMNNQLLTGFSNYIKIKKIDSLKFETISYMKFNEKIKLCTEPDNFAENMEKYINISRKLPFIMNNIISKKQKDEKNNILYSEIIMENNNFVDKNDIINTIKKQWTSDCVSKNTQSSEVENPTIIYTIKMKTEKIEKNSTTSETSNNTSGISHHHAILKPIETDKSELLNSPKLFKSETSSNLPLKTEIIKSEHEESISKKSEQIGGKYYKKYKQYKTLYLQIKN